MRIDGGLYAHAGEIATYPQVDEWAEEARFYEQAGFTGLWVAEHHFFWDGWYTPTPTNPVLAGAFLASQTSRLRIGQCGVALPDWHPLRVAEDVAMLDHMTHGRVDFGIIRGINNRVGGNFNRNAARGDQARNYRLFSESLDVVLKAWSGEPFRHEGEFYTFPAPGWKDNSAPPEELDPRYYAPDGELISLEVHPKPYQRPHPPIWQMSDNAPSYRFAAERGIGVMAWGKSLEGLRECWTAYQETASRVQARPVPFGEGMAIMRGIYVTETMEEAERDMRPGLNAQIAKSYHADPSLGRRSLRASYEPLSDEDLNCDWYDFLVRNEWCIAGTPEYVTEKLQRFESELGLKHLVLYWALAGLTHAKVMRSLELFAERVMPHFQESQN